MKRAKLNNDKITALYCRLSKGNGTNNKSMITIPVNGKTDSAISQMLE